jgi:hypothetical protein
MGRNTAQDAATALRLLNSEDLRENPETGPRERRTTSSTPSAPLNIGVVDYLARTVDEIVDHATAVTPQPAPLPRQIGDLYTWYLEQTAEADDVERLHRDTVIETHALEHAIRLGEYKVVRPHPCPRCGSWGLYWDSAGSRARCTDVDCRTPDGFASSWTLARLAAQKVQRTEIWRRNAT